MTSIPDHFLNPNSANDLKLFQGKKIKINFLQHRNMNQDHFLTINSNNDMKMKKNGFFTPIFINNLYRHHE